MKFKAGDKILVVNRGSEATLWNNMTKGLVAVVEKTSVHGYLQVRTEGNNMLEGKGVRITVHEDQVVPVTEMSKAIYS